MAVQLAGVLMESDERVLQVFNMATEAISKMGEPPERSTYVVIEYFEPISPHNRALMDFGFGPVEFKATFDEARAFGERLGGAPAPFRVVPMEYAKKFGLYPE